MNRRNFLKLTGATFIVLATPKIFASTNRWIPFTKEMPEVGQKVAVFTYFEGNSRNILTGKVVDSSYDYRYWFKGEVISIDVALSHSLDNSFKAEDVRTYKLISKNMGYDSSRKDIQRAKWIKGKKITYSGMTTHAPRHGMKQSEYVGRNESYWYPINEYIPRDLPDLPVAKPVNIVIKDGKEILVKD